MAQELSYSQNQLATDAKFAGRVSSILKDEGYVPVGESATQTAWTYIEDIAAEPGLAEAYHSALIAGIEDPGISNEVIPDGMLLSAVTAVMGRVA